MKQASFLPDDDHGIRRAPAEKSPRKPPPSTPQPPAAEGKRQKAKGESSRDYKKKETVDWEYLRQAERMIDLGNAAYARDLLAHVQVLTWRRDQLLTQVALLLRRIDQEGQ